MRRAYRSVFFLSYYNREGSEEYRDFTDRMKSESARRFGYVYGEDEEVS